MEKKKLLIIGGIVLVLVIAGAANRFLGKSAAERAFEEATGGKVKVDSNGNDVTVKTDQGTWSTSDKLPSDWPSDVPVYAGAKVTASVTGAGQQESGLYAALETTDAIADVISWYKREVVSAGWTIETDAMVNGTLMLSATKGARGLSVTVTGEEGKVAVGLVVVNK